MYPLIQNVLHLHKHNLHVVNELHEVLLHAVRHVHVPEAVVLDPDPACEQVDVEQPVAVVQVEPPALLPPRAPREVAVRHARPVVEVEPALVAEQVVAPLLLQLVVDEALLGELPLELRVEARRVRLAAALEEVEREERAAPLVAVVLLQRVITRVPVVEVLFAEDAEARGRGLGIEARGGEPRDGNGRRGEFLEG